ncbi:MAG: class I SAM-dependent methyltransferase [Pedobacter sp.]|nr:MAG: class I SAM-dependent methyltransferase [Pedobacter sp.]
MSHQPSEEELRNIARQLRQPEGEHGIKTGEMMNVSNIEMTNSAIDALNLCDEETVLEIGHGNGGHIANLLSKALDLKYVGADISETIITEAKRINTDFIGQVDFKLTNGISLPFSDAQFDKIFSVNTIYFWENPAAYLLDIKRVLKPGGSFLLCFADKSFMEKLPFTKYGFILYDLDAIIALLQEAGFNIGVSIKKTEQIKSSLGFMVERDYYVVSASK